MFKEFKEFIQRGNAMDLAVAFILGGAFTAIVTSLVGDMIMPIISLITKGVDFSQMYLTLDGGSYASLAEAKEAGAAIFAYGNFINAIIHFIIIAFVVFILVRSLNRMKKAEVVEEEEETEKTCPYCQTSIPIAATRCPHCTSELS